MKCEFVTKTKQHQRSLNSTSQSTGWRERSTTVPYTPTFRQIEIPVIVPLSHKIYGVRHFTYR